MRRENQSRNHIGVPSSLGDYLQKYRGRVAVLALLSVSNALLVFIIPFVTKALLQRGETGHFPGATEFLYFVAALAGLFVVSLIDVWFKLAFEVRFKTDESKLLFEALLAVKLQHIERKGPTYFTNRIMMSIGHIFQLVGSFSASLVVSLIKIVVSLIIVFALNKVLFFGFVVLLPLTFLSYRKLNARLQEKTNAMQRILAVSGQSVTNIVQNIFAFKQLRNHSRIAEVVRNHFKTQLDMNQTVNRFASAMSLTINFVIGLVRSGILFLTIYYFLSHRMSLADLVFINILLEIYFSALSTLNSLNISKRDMHTAMNFVKDDILSCQEEDRGQITLERVETLDLLIDHFDYEEKPGVLRAIHLTIRNPERVALVGETGCGKSTLVRLPGRFYDASEVRVNGRDVTEYTLDSLRSRIYLCPQDSFIFPGSVIENITIGLRDVDTGKLKRVLRQPFMISLGDELPNGFDTFIGEGSTNLSGGQKQKLLIARALLRDPDVLILDESTSSLDGHSEELVFKSVEEFCQDRTVMIVSHRLSTVQHSSRIVVMKEGMIVGDGTHQNLIANCDEYKKIFSSQLDEDEDGQNRFQNCMLGAANEKS